MKFDRTEIWKKSHANDLVRPIIFILCGFGLGILTRLIRPIGKINDLHYEVIAAAAFLIAALLALAVDRRKARAVLLFQLENLAVCMGFFLGWSLIHGAFWEDFMGVSFVFWLCASVIGGMIVSLPLPRKALAAD